MNTIPHFNKIYLERTICYLDNCPVYKLFVTSKGNVHLTQVIEFGFKKRMRKWKIDQYKVDRLNEIIIKYGYFKIKEKETTEGATDMPFCITEIELNNGEKRKMEHYLGDNAYPKRLTTIENWIDKITNVNHYLVDGQYIIFEK